MKRLLENQIIGRRIEETWPPRSTDLTPLNYYYVPRNIEDLKQKNSQIIDNVSIEEIYHAVLHIRKKLILYRNTIHVIYKITKCTKYIMFLILL